MTGASLRGETNLPPGGRGDSPAVLSHPGVASGLPPSISRDHPDDAAHPRLAVALRPREGPALFEHGEREVLEDVVGLVFASVERLAGDLEELGAEGGDEGADGAPVALRGQSHEKIELFARLEHRLNGLSVEPCQLASGCIFHDVIPVRFEGAPLPSSRAPCEGVQEGSSFDENYFGVAGVTGVAGGTAPLTAAFC